MLQLTTGAAKSLLMERMKTVWGFTSPMIGNGLIFLVTVQENTSVKGPKSIEIKKCNMCLKMVTTDE